MKYRALDKNGDYVFGKGKSEFYVDTPEAVAQAVLTRLLLVRGEWFLDVTEGVPYKTDILGFGNLLKYDFIMQETIFDTPGVKSISNYNSYFNQETRKVTISATISTIYGDTSLETTL